MLNTLLLSPRTTVREDPQPVAGVSYATAEKIVNIAGIVAGDRVMFFGGPDRMIEAAVADTGARFIAGNGTKRIWPLSSQGRADVVLCAVSAFGRDEPSAALRVIRHLLRPGGRLVLWAGSTRDQRTSVVAERLRQSISPAGFTSVIVGRIALDSGDMVLGTGISK
jgi:SAM-dependent methyltransferase